MPKCRILSYGCSSSAGSGVQDFWKGLREGAETARTGAWPDLSLDRAAGALEVLQHHSLLAWQDCRAGLSGPARARFQAGRLGVILASTKGCIDDLVWRTAPDLSRDPLTPLLDAFVAAAELAPTDTLCVSNACASGLTALLLASEWLEQDRVDHVLVLAADHPARFVHRGFEQLKVLTPTRSRPFARNRDGLVLGDAAAAILLSRLSGNSEDAGAVELEALATDTEGYAVTRPDQSGDSLRRACRALAPLQGPAAVTPDLIVAHGTGTVINDQTEDQVFFSLFGDRVPVTATKWSIGHTLGASAAMDVIAACEVLRQQAVFRIGSTEEVDPGLRSRYLTSKTDCAEPFPASRVLVTSLGFGGVHAAALLHLIPAGSEVA